MSRTARKSSITQTIFESVCSARLAALAHRELGKVYEELEEYDKAREAYEYFVEYWADADLQPMVEEARQAIIRLTPLRPE